MLLIEGDYLSCDQAALTGESLPVSKKVGDDAYSGAIAKQGSMTGVVTATGERTFFGRTAKLVGAAGAVSHSQRAVTQVGDFLLLLAFFLALILVGAQLYREVIATHDWSWDRIGAIAQYVLVLLIASIPVALPAVMSVTMAIGAYALSLQKAIVSRLSAIEELAGVDVLCSDKTGTLTMNRLTVQQPIPFGSFKDEDVLLFAALATQKSSADAIDLAVMGALPAPTTLDGYKQTAFTPFDPVSKRTIATAVDGAGRTRHYAKGAPQAISALAKPDAPTLQRYQAEVAALAAKGERALGVAMSEDGVAWALVGLISLMDPPRADAKATIAQARALGLNVKMVTGDDVAIGDQIAAQLGMGDHLLVASDVFKDGAKSDALPRSVVEAVERADGFGRVFPEHKYEIVKALQSVGHIVAMTGDGVNDAPALKQADCGIAVSGATDAARSAAALILTAPGLSTIINAIGVSRQIFQRIESYIHYRIAMTLDIMIVVVASIVLFQFQPLTAIMIVALALLDDIPIMTIAYDNVPVAPLPVRWDMHRILRLRIADGSAVGRGNLRLSADRHALDAGRSVASNDFSRSGSAPDAHFSAARRRRPSSAVFGANEECPFRAALSERQAILGHRGDAGRRRVALPLRRRRRGDPRRGDRRRVALLPPLARRHRLRQISIQALVREARGRRRRGPRQSCGLNGIWRARRRSMNFIKKFRVEPGSAVDLKSIDPGFHGAHANDVEAADELQRNLARITELQRKLYADRKHSLLIVLQGIDGAGKDGTCWHVISAMDPQGVQVTGFKQPTPEEQEHDFLWRVHPHAPRRGFVSIFNRSHYEDVLVVRVHKLAPKDVWKPRYDFINDWEKLLAVENNTTILKFFLYISKEEQLKRFKERLDDPARQWKISASDYSERDKWDDYIKAFEAALSRCSTEHAPWFIIPSNHKWFRNLAASTIIADTLENLNLQLPKPTVDIEEIRKLYHQAKEAETSSGKQE